MEGNGTGTGGRRVPAALVPGPPPSLPPRPPRRGGLSFPPAVFPGRSPRPRGPAAAGRWKVSLLAGSEKGMALAAALAALLGRWRYPPSSLPSASGSQVAQGQVAGPCLKRPGGGWEVL